MAKPCLPIVGAIIALLFVTSARAAEEVTPEEVVKRYLGAVQNQDFDKAYGLVSKAMKTDRKTGQVKPKEVWVKEQQYIFAFSEAKIFDFKVLPGKIEGDKAIVPDILSSQDKFLNQLGVEEYELYTLVKEEGAWRVDQQQEVVEQSEVAKWFPKKSDKAPPPSKH
jgi:hypothetical protein